MSKPSAKLALDPGVAERFLAADLANLLRKIKTGHPLTKHERNLVVEYAQTGSTDAASESFASNQTELAKRLGVSRQLVTYHCKRPGNPGRTDAGRYPIGAWRKYFAAFGRVLPDEPAAEPASRYVMDFGDGADATFETIGKILPRAVDCALEAAGIASTPAQRDVFAFNLYRVLAAHVDALLKRHGLPSVFEPGDDGTVDYAPAIREVATRIVEAAT